MRSKSKWWMLLSGASMAAIGAVAPAAAQEVSDEIVVTATGRSAAIQDVPIAVTAIGHEMLEQSGVRNLIDLRQVTPNLRIGSGQSQSSGTSAAIRGIGTGSDNPGFEAAVGIFIDGVYRARAGAAISDLPDIERVEILRGPQGTLYGKNTTAGAISVVTASPSFEPGAWLEGTGGDLELAGTRFGFNAPLSDTLAVRFDGTVRSRDGYITDVISNRSVNTTGRWGGRAQALWDVTPNATMRVILDAAGSDEICCGAVTFADTSSLAAFDFSAAVNATQPGAILTASPDARLTTISPNRNYNEETEELGLSAQLDWGIGNVNLTSITAVRDWDSTRNQDIDFSSMDRSYRAGLEIGVSSITQEIRLQGEAGRVNWLVGGFFGQEEVLQTDRIRYGTQAANFIDNLVAPFNLSIFGGVGNTIFGCTVGTNCIIQNAFTAFGFVNGFNTVKVDDVVPGSAAILGAAGPTFAADMIAAGLPDGTGQQADRWGIDTTSYALFTHDEINLNDSTVLTLGVRWTHEEKDMTANLNAIEPACEAIRDNVDAVYAALLFQYTNQQGGAFSSIAQPLADGLPSALILTCNPAVNDVQNGAHSRSLSDDALSGTASLSYHVNDDLMLYGGYSRGYKSGGFNIDRSGMTVRPWTTTGAPTPYAQAVIDYLGTQGIALPTTFGAADLQFEPETIDAYELGFKSTLFGGAATLNMAAFYQQLHDYQLNAFNGFNFITRNVPEVISQGAELEFSARPTDALTLSLGVLFDEVFYDSSLSFGDNETDQVNAGDPLTLSPEWTVTGSVLYEVPISDALKLSFYANGRYVTDYRLQTLGRNPLTDQPEYAIFDARIGLGGRDEHWGLEIWGRNLTDEYYSIGAFAVPEQSLAPDVGPNQGRFAAYPNEPATYGVTLRARY